MPLLNQRKRVKRVDLVECAVEEIGILQPDQHALRLNWLTNEFDTRPRGGGYQKQTRNQKQRPTFLRPSIESAKDSGHYLLRLTSAISRIHFENQCALDPRPNG